MPAPMPCQSEDDGGPAARQLSGKVAITCPVPLVHQDYSQVMKPVHLQQRAVKRSRPFSIAATVQLPPVHHALPPTADSSAQPCTPGQAHPAASLPERQRPVQAITPRAVMTTARTPLMSLYCPSAGALLLGIRLSISSPQGSRMGKIVDVQGSGGKHLIRFDDGSCEWLCLPNCSWRWHTPRAISAGLTPALCQALRKMGAANLAPEPQPPTTAPPGVRLTATPASVVGQQVWLWCAASGSWHAGMVVASSHAGSGSHHVVYQQDGSDEWVILSKEVVLWAESQGELNQHICPPQVTCQGPVPAGAAAVNRRVGVYWREDQSFWEGTVTKYLASSGEHQVVYDDGEEEVVRLQDDVVIWRCQAAPGQTATRAITSRKASAAEQDVGRPQQRQRITPHQQPIKQVMVGMSPSPAVNAVWPALRQSDTTEACRSTVASPSCGPVASLPGCCVSSA